MECYHVYPVLSSYRGLSTCPLPPANRLLITVHYLLFTAYYLLLTIYYVLLTKK